MYFLVYFVACSVYSTPWMSKQTGKKITRRTFVACAVFRDPQHEHKLDSDHIQRLRLQPLTSE